MSESRELRGKLPLQLWSFPVETGRNVSGKRNGDGHSPHGRHELRAIGACSALSFKIHSLIFFYPNGDGAILQGQFRARFWMAP